MPDLGESAQTELTPLLEKRVGETIMRDIRLREPSYLDDPEVNAYLNRLGSRLVAQAAEVRQDFEFFALKDSTLNAFALPGGFIGVHTGLVLAAQSESELASVLAHEISHVTQRHLARLVGKQNQSQLGTLAALAVAILAARSNPEIAVGAAVAGQAAGIQHQLNYSRDFEHEADRVGIQLLEKSGFDIRGMGSFFERLQRFGRLYENNAPGYLRTHPLTTERIADMENRIHQRTYRQVPDSLDFLLVRAKLRAQEGTPQDAVLDFTNLVRDRKFNSEAAARHGLAHAQLRAKNHPAVDKEIAELRRLKVVSPMVETLAAESRARQGDLPGAIGILRSAIVRYPQERALSYALVEDLIAAGQGSDALKAVTADLQDYPQDARAHALQARAYAILGKRLQQHRAQAESYFLQGQLLAAIEQLQFAQK
ncbi:MAG: M48 family metallopeptidase, partial [Rhodocyclaceae bacterium]|nr:M48 family metallopeptidase [Rhodocyclaceae bacterium]